MTHDALLAAVLADPRDDTRRLALADLLDETDQPARAAFIRAQVAVARHGDANMACERSGRKLSHTGEPGPLFESRCRCRPCGLARSEYRASCRHVTEWERVAIEPYLKEYADAVIASITGRDVRGQWPVMRDQFSSRPRVRFRRGFVDRVTLTSESFRTHGAALFARNPVEAFVLPDAELRVEIDPPGDGHDWQAYYFGPPPRRYVDGGYLGMNVWERREDVVPGVIRELGMDQARAA
ncbi:TIGR02996 domain-containing protein [Gemmata sp.]|uniref:TIGR02996 domain-containing protein n=1 Tax=Gemmata sp. TaxID=1914242 RepID=UPI003F70C256